MSETTKACPHCGEQILAVAVKCKHCGSMLTGATVPGVAPAAALNRQFIMRPAIAIPAVILLALLSLTVAAHWRDTYTLTGNGFSSADVTRLERNISIKLAAQRWNVVDVELMRQSPTELTGFAKVRVPLLGIVTKTCTVTMGEDRETMWQCK